MKAAKNTAATILVVFSLGIGNGAQTLPNTGAEFTATATTTTQEA